MVGVEGGKPWPWGESEEGKKKNCAAMKWMMQGLLVSEMDRERVAWLFQIISKVYNGTYACMWAQHYQRHMKWYG